MFLEESKYKAVIENTPLVSIDLIVKDPKGRVLLGKRVNPPACGFWFVPGGRILKNERMTAAFKRITEAELGRSCAIEGATLIGPYDHLYEDSIFGPFVSTHYVVIAYEMNVDELPELPRRQHSTYRWVDVGELLEDPYVHANVKAYF